MVKYLTEQLEMSNPNKTLVSDAGNDKSPHGNVQTHFSCATGPLKDEKKKAAFF